MIPPGYLATNHQRLIASSQAHYVAREYSTYQAPCSNRLARITFTLCVANFLALVHYLGVYY